MPGFDSIIDQERPIRILSSLLKNGTIPHALLFTGIEGIGKRTAAIALAMACNCTGPRAEERMDSGPQGPAAEACGECSACRRIAAGVHPDVVMLAPAGPQIKIDQIRELCQSLVMKPYEARLRVVIVADAHCMNPAAGNAFLKMLEEPPERTVLILTAHQQADLLPTVVSRCQHLRFKPIARRHLAAILIKAYGFPAEEAELTAVMANGSVTRALDMRRSQWMRRRNWFLCALAALPGQPMTATLALVERMTRSKEDIPVFLELMATWMRDLVVSRHDPDRIHHIDLGPQVIAAARTMDPSLCLQAAADLEDARRRILANANPRLALEAFWVKLAAAMQIL